MEKIIHKIRTKHIPRMRKVVRRVKGFSLIELLMVLAIISILASTLYPRMQQAREKGYFSRAKGEFKTMNQALTQYYLDNNATYPPDVNRDIPAGIAQYIGGYQANTWPKAPWPNSVYDWDNWTETDGSKIYQISVRFCPANATSTASCTFPDEPWATNFNVNSAAYYCISGACRSHINEVASYPGYCVNC